MRIPRLKSAPIEAAVLTVVIGLVLLWVTWQLAAPGPQPGSEELTRDNRFLSSELAAVKLRLDRAQARLAVLERESAVLRQANRLLREQESERQAEMNTLQSELDFYRRLAGTGGQQSGVDVYRAELLPTGSPQVFQFQLTLTQNIRRASIINGRARIDLEGTLDDRPVTLPWSELGEGGAPEPSFRFKYFQQLEGYLALPQNFLPTRLVVTLEVRDQRTPVQRSYAWESLLVDEAD